MVDVHATFHITTPAGRNRRVLGGQSPHLDGERCVIVALAIGSTAGRTPSPDQASKPSGSRPYCR